MKLYGKTFLLKQGISTYLKTDQVVPLRDDLMWLGLEPGKDFQLDETYGTNTFVISDELKVHPEVQSILEKHNVSGFFGK